MRYILHFAGYFDIPHMTALHYSPSVSFHIFGNWTFMEANLVSKDKLLLALDFCMVWLLFRKFSPMKLKYLKFCFRCGKASELE